MRIKIFVPNKTQTRQFFDINKGWITYCARRNTKNRQIRSKNLNYALLVILKH